MTLCGLSACVDATASLHDAAALLAASEPAAAHFASALVARAAAGIGGEIRVDWPGGPAWLDAHLAFRRDLGGTGPQAARVLTLLGAPVLLALRTRSPEQLAVLDPKLPLAQAGRVVTAEHVAADRPNATKTYIFEFTQGRRLGSVVPPRSSRIIVRFDDPGLEEDAEFEILSRRLAPHAGAAILSGFNSLGSRALGPALERTRALARDWRRAEIPAIHLELAGYARPEYRDMTLSALAGCATSFGLSLSEFRSLQPGGQLAEGMRALAERMQVRRVCMHADEWAASATLDDPAREREALLMGGLLAGARAEAGRPVVPHSIPAGAVFERPPAFPEALGAWHFATCATPYLAQPAATVGLGDTFTAGCLLVLGAQRSCPTRSPAAPSLNRK
jgi:ADP-dependent phosphofructokinase/glucokinase